MEPRVGYEVLPLRHKFTQDISQRVRLRWWNRKTNTSGHCTHRLVRVRGVVETLTGKRVVIWSWAECLHNTEPYAIVGPIDESGAGVYSPDRKI